MNHREGENNVNSSAMTPEHTALVDAFQYAVDTGNHNGVARKALLDALRELQEKFNNSAQLAAERFAETIKLSAELREQAGEIERLNAKLPCGHSKDLDDSYGGCVLCQFKNGYEQYEAENEKLEAERDTLALEIERRVMETERLLERNIAYRTERDTLRVEVKRLHEGWSEANSTILSRDMEIIGLKAELADFERYGGTT